MSAEKIDNIAELLKDVLSGVSTENAITDYIKFGGEVAGKGMLWQDSRTGTKQFIFRSTEDGFFSSEHITLNKDKNIRSNGIDLLTSTSLGNSVTKSNLKELGRLKGLIVDGSANISQYFIFDSVTNRLGIGSDQPKNSITIAEDNTEIVIGPNGHGRGSIGTYNYTDFDIITDNSAKITVKSSGDIDLGTISSGPIKVSVSGTLSINVNNPDSRANLQVSGAIKFNDNLHLSLDAPPKDGNFTAGDIVWNSSPKVGKSVGWVCTRSGNPGTWNAFGDIKERN